jgi:hypothetical protein
LEGFEAMSHAWRNAGEMSPDARRAMEEGCKQATEALEQAAGAMCGW